MTYNVLSGTLSLYTASTVFVLILCIRQNSLRLKLPRTKVDMLDYIPTCGFRTKDPCIGDVMRKFAPFLKLYSEYVKNFDSAMETITYWMDKCPRFLQIVKDVQVCSL